VIYDYRSMTCAPDASQADLSCILRLNVGPKSYLREIGAYGNAIFWITVSLTSF
jgi:hypothetical protein